MILHERYPLVTKHLWHCCQRYYFKFHLWNATAKPIGSGCKPFFTWTTTKSKTAQILRRSNCKRSSNKWPRSTPHVRYPFGIPTPTILTFLNWNNLLCACPYRGPSECGTRRHPTKTHVTWTIWKKHWLICPRQRKSLNLPMSTCSIDAQKQTIL